MAFPVVLGEQAFPGGPFDHVAGASDVAVTAERACRDGNVAEPVEHLLTGEGCGGVGLDEGTFAAVARGGGVPSMGFRLRCPPWWTCPFHRCEVRAGMGVGSDAGLVTRVEAAQILGITAPAMEGVIRRGELSVAVSGVRGRPSLLRGDVEALAQRRRAEATRRKRSRSVAEARRRARESVRAALPRGEWLFTPEVARLLGVSTVYVQRLAAQDRIPHIVRPEGYVFPAHQIRLVANARRVRRADDPVAALRA